METKICKGVLHPEGVELPIDFFQYKNNISRPKPNITTGSVCNKCRTRKKNLNPHSIELRRKYPKAHKKECVQYSLKYRRANLEKIKQYDKERQKCHSINLSDYYVKSQLRFMGISDSNKNNIELKREQLKLIRLCRSLKTTQKS